MKKNILSILVIVALCLSIIALVSSNFSEEIGARFGSMRNVNNMEVTDFNTVSAPATKTTICHLLPGTIDQYVTLTILSSNLNDHISHGDKKGRCIGTPVKETNSNSSR